MRFTKMQGLGNDYLFFYGPVPEGGPELARRLSDRRFGVGADGIIFITPSSAADFGMRIFNADGSEAEMCGNGIRCLGKYVYEKGCTDRTELAVETLAGVRRLTLRVERGRVRSVTVDMGRAAVGADALLDVRGEEIACTPVRMGNPHAVVFCGDAGRAPVAELGPLLERHPRFPARTNVEFVEVSEQNRLRMRVWERGSGVTLACGTGACACAAAAVHKGLCDASRPICAELDGGKLTIDIEADGGVRMTGPAEFVFEGDVPG